MFVTVAGWLLICVLFVIAQRARRRYLTVMGIALIYLVIGFPLGIWIEALVRD